jgi:hypothetical protein
MAMSLSAEMGHTAMASAVQVWSADSLNSSVYGRHDDEYKKWSTHSAVPFLVALKAAQLAQQSFAH